jgi:hypothetical protein
MLVLEPASQLTGQLLHYFREGFKESTDFGENQRVILVEDNDMVLIWQDV